MFWLVFMSYLHRREKECVLVDTTLDVDDSIETPLQIRSWILIIAIESAVKTEQREWALVDPTLELDNSIESPLLIRSWVLTIGMNSETKNGQSLMF